MFLDGLATAEQLRNLLTRNKARRNELLKKITLLKNSNMNDEALQDLENNILGKLFDDLAAKNLPQSIYESLLNDAQITATCYANHVEFHTLYGSFCLPRIRSSNRLWMPKWELSLFNAKTNGNSVIDKNTHITVTYFTGIKTEFAFGDNLRIISR